MSKMTTLVGPPLESGMLDRMRARVTAVATSPSASTWEKNREILKYATLRECELVLFHPSDLSCLEKVLFDGLALEDGKLDR